MHEHLPGGHFERHKRRPDRRQIRRNCDGGASAFRSRTYYSLVRRRDCAMAQVHFTTWLRQYVPDGPVSARGATVGDALADIFAERPHVRGYVLDEQGRL